MASRLTGSDHLLQIRTDRIELTVKAKTQRNPLGPDAKATSVLRISGHNLESIRLGNENHLDISEKGFSVHHINTLPLFFEQTDYIASIHSLHNEELSVSCNNPLIEGALDYPYPNDKAHMVGVINYGNNIGFSEFTVYANGSPVVSLRIEIYPTKISYQDDYRAMMDDINDLVSECVLDFMKKTFQVFIPNHKKNDIPAVFFTVFQGIYNKYLQAIRRVTAVPHHKLITVHEIVPTYKAKRTDNRTLHWINTHPEYVQIVDGKIKADRILAARKQITYDTSENQLVKYMLQSTVRRIEDFCSRYIAGNNESAVRTDVVNKAQQMTSELCHLLSNTFLSDVSAYKASQSMSLVFGMAPGYREMYKYWLMLQNGLTVGGDVFHMSVRETSQLYEYWCFIKLYSILKRRYTLKSPDMIKIDRRGVTVDLVKGTKSRIEFLNDQTGESIVLSYNPTEFKTQTVNQRPDNVLELKKKGSKNLYKYIFDAKYRIESNPDSNFYPDTKPGPKVDDINTMHRYRDSIVYENTESRFVFEKAMFGAYILFPYGSNKGEEEEYRNHRFYRSIDSVNIGGLPFLPTATKLVTEKLDELISSSPESAFEKASLPVGTEERLEKANWSERDVLIGVAKDKQALDVMLKNRFYYTPRVTLDHLPIRRIALYMPKAQFGDNSGICYFGEVINFQKLQRSDIKEIPTEHNGNETCYRFQIKEWKELKQPIRIRDRGIRSIAYTNAYLLKNASHTDELFIRTEEQYRFYTEMKHLIREDQGYYDRNTGHFEMKGLHIGFEGNQLIAQTADGVILEQIPTDEFRKHPGTVFYRIYQHTVDPETEESDV